MLESAALLAYDSNSTADFRCASRLASGKGDGALCASQMKSNSAGDQRIIHAATVEDLPSISAYAEEFYAQSKHLKAFDAATFEQSWKQFLLLGIGVILISIEDDHPTGWIGGISYPDVNSGKQTAIEMFWFVRPGSRGSGVRLYREFEQWARLKGCDELRMVHLSDSMPDKLKRFYEAQGFDEVETHYAKELR